MPGRSHQRKRKIPDKRNTKKDSWWESAAMQKTVLDKDIQETPAPWEAAVFLIIDGVLLRYIGRDTFGTVQIAPSSY